MKKALIKSVSLILALTLILSASFSANAANFNETKTKTFLDKVNEEQAITFEIGDMSYEGLQLQDCSFYLKIKDIATLNSVYENYSSAEHDINQDSIVSFFKEQLKNIEICGKAKIRGIPIKILFNGKEIYMYFFGLFKVNLGKALSDKYDDKTITELLWLYIHPALEYYSVFSLLSSVLAKSMVVEKQNSSNEKFLFSRVRFLSSVTGASEKKIQEAFANYFREMLSKYADYNSEEIDNYYEHLLKNYYYGEINSDNIDNYIRRAFSDGSLLTVLSSAGIEIKDPPPPHLILAGLRVYYIGTSAYGYPDWLEQGFGYADNYSSVEFIFNGSNLADIVFNKVTGETFTLSDFSAFMQSYLDAFNANLTITAGKGKISTPLLAFDLTPLAGIMSRSRSK